MKATVCVLFLSVILILISYQSKAQESQLVAYKLSKISPNVDKNLKVFGYDTTSDFIFIYHDIRLFKRIVPIDSIVNGIVTSSGFYNRYFVHHIDSIYGRLFDSMMRMVNQRVHIDSGTASKSLFNKEIENDFKSLKIEPVKKNIPIDDFCFKEVYFIFDLDDSTKKSIWTLTYSNSMKKNPLSISTYMDSLRSSKLVEIRTDEPQRFLKKYNLTMDPFFFIYRMEPYEILEKEIIMNLIKVYAKETGLNFDD